MNTKYCPKCEAVIDINLFKKNIARHDGLSVYCKPHDNEYARELYNKNKDRIRDSKNATHRKSYAKHVDKRRLDRRVYYSFNKEKEAEKYREYYLKNKDKRNKCVDEYYRKNPEKRIIKAQRRRARKLNLENSFTVEDWISTLNIFDNRCVYCQVDDIKLAQDHFIAVKHNGPYKLGNIVPACKFCNSSKRDILPEIFIKDKDLYIKIMLKLDALVENKKNNNEK